MKTLREYERVESEAHQKLIKEFLIRERQWLSAVESQNIPLYKQTEPDQYDVAEMRKALRDKVREGKAARQGVSCDCCGTELVDRKDGRITFTDPPQIYVGCPGCGWIGHKTIR